MDEIETHKKILNHLATEIALLAERLGFRFCHVIVPDTGKEFLSLERIEDGEKVTKPKEIRRYTK